MDSGESRDKRHEYQETKCQEYHIQPINPNGAQVLNVDSNQRLAQAIAHISGAIRIGLAWKLFWEFTCEGVSFPFEFAGDGVHADADDGFDGG